MPDLNQEWHGQPLWLWYIGGVVVAAGAFVFIRRYQKNKAAATNATGTNAGAYPSTTGFPTGAISQPLPGMGAITPIIFSGPWTPPQTSAPPSAGVPSSRQIDPNAYYPLSQSAANALLASGGTGYQSGQEAIDWALQHGAAIPPGVSASAYYPLSPQAAQGLIASGKPVYQSGQQALQWQQQHPGG